MLSFHIIHTDKGHQQIGDPYYTQLQRKKNSFLSFFSFGGGGGVYYTQVCVIHELLRLMHFTGELYFRRGPQGANWVSSF